MTVPAMRLLEQCWQDVRFGFRMLRKNPGFTIVAVLTLALGIALNTAVFGLLDAVLLHQLAYPDAERLVWLSDYDEGWGDGMVSPAAYHIWKESTTSFEQMVGYGNEDAALTVGAESTQERIAYVEYDFGELAGAQPSLGHLFHPKEPNTIVLSHELFVRRFGADPNVIGKTVTLDGHLFTVTGVLTQGFEFLFPQEPSERRRQIDAYVPLSPAVMGVWSVTEPQYQAIKNDVGPTPWAVYVIAKLKRGITFAHARSEMEGIFDRVKKEHYPVWRQDTHLHMAVLKDRVIGDGRRALLIMQGAVGFVLLIVCVNIASLLLARALTRQKEMAVRLAVGVGWPRLVRQFVTESVLLTSIGGIAGLLLAKGILVAMIRLGSEVIPRITQASMNSEVLAFNFAASLVMGLVFGLTLALGIKPVNLQNALKSDTSHASVGGRRTGVRELLTVVQFALALVLLTGAGLMAKSFWLMTTYPPGFEPAKILSMRVTLYGKRYATLLQRGEYVSELLRRIEAVPNVEAAGVHQGTLNAAVKVDGVSSSPGREPYAAIQGVSVGYLRAMGLRLNRGSWPADGSFDTFVVNESFVRRRLVPRSRLEDT
jgi:putative ABC transport system permease protein